MSLERVLKLLEDLGLSRDEAEVYVYLAKRGPQTQKVIIENLKKDKKIVTIALRGLEKKRITTRKSKRSTLFSAIPFEELLTDYVKITFNQAKRVEQKRLTLLTDWLDTLAEGIVEKEG